MRVVRQSDQKQSGWFTIVAVNLVVFAALFTTGELVVRSLFCNSLACDQSEIFTRRYPGEVHERKLHKGLLADDDLGWRLDPDFTPPPPNTPALRWSHDYRVNREGFRNNEDFAVAATRPDPPRIMVLGDSFVFGTGLDRNATFTSALERGLGGRYRVYNAGVSGWGIDQMLLAYQKFAPVLRPQIVLLVFIDPDFARALHAFRSDAGGKPMLMLQDGKLVRRKAGVPLYERIARRSLILNRFYLRALVHPEERQLHHAIFSQLIRTTRDRGQRLLILRYPDYDGLRRETREARHDFSALFREHEVTYYDPYPIARRLGISVYWDFYQHDSHPSGAGNAGVVRYLIQMGFPGE